MCVISCSSKSKSTFESLKVSLHHVRVVYHSQPTFEVQNLVWVVAIFSCSCGIFCIYTKIIFQITFLIKVFEYKSHSNSLLTIIKFKNQVDSKSNLPNSNLNTHFNGMAPLTSRLCLYICYQQFYFYLQFYNHIYLPVYSITFPSVFLQKIVD